MRAFLLFSRIYRKQCGEEGRHQTNMSNRFSAPLKTRSSGECKNAEVYSLFSILLVFTVLPNGYYVPATHKRNVAFNLFAELHYERGNTFLYYFCAFPPCHSCIYLILRIFYFSPNYSALRRRGLFLLA